MQRVLLIVLPVHVCIMHHLALFAKLENSKTPNLHRSDVRNFVRHSNFHFHPYGADFFQEFNMHCCSVTVNFFSFSSEQFLRYSKKSNLLVAWFELDSTNLKSYRKFFSCYLESCNFQGLNTTHTSLFMIFFRIFANLVREIRD